MLEQNASALLELWNPLSIVGTEGKQDAPPPPATALCESQTIDQGRRDKRPFALFFSLRQRTFRNPILAMVRQRLISVFPGNIH